MIRGGLLLLGLLIGCSGSENLPPPACTIPGTFSLTYAIESASDGCGSFTDAGKAQVSGSPTMTITARPPGKTGPDFALEFQGATGACGAERAGECKITAKCDVHILDALDPNNAIGTQQYSLTFTNDGFSGFEADSIPPSKSIPKGCQVSATVSGTRR